MILFLDKYFGRKAMHRNYLFLLYYNTLFGLNSARPNFWLIWANYIVQLKRPMKNIIKILTKTTTYYIVSINQLYAVHIVQP